LIFNKKRGLPDFLRSNIKKEEEKDIKDKLRDKYSFKEYYLEKFSIDIQEYILNGNIKMSENYYLFNNNGDYVNVKIS
ncbi:B12-binding domain-containing radical SAM protein, partial [Clostridium botulinum]|nr:B12-binding domain-containing radical SAM protein [Clostridium botulinum]